MNPVASSLTDGAKAPARVLLVGAYPPPIGGNSIHIQRLRQRLQASGAEVQVLDYLGGHRPAAPDGVIRLPSSPFQRLAALIRFSRTVPADTLVHFHVSALGRFKWVAPLLLRLFKRQPRVITLHSGSFVAQAQRLPRPYLRWLFRAFHAVIPVNDNQAAFLSALGLPADRLRCIPAFLAENAGAGPDALPAAVRDQLKGRQLIVTSGDLTPIYQYGPLLDAASPDDAGPVLRPDRHLVVLALYGRSEPAYAREILERAAQLPHVLVLRDQSPEAFLSLLNAADVYVRPTRTDGDSVAVREALALGCQVIASDAAPRPAACHVFPLGDTARFRAALDQALTTARAAARTEPVTVPHPEAAAASSVRSSARPPADENFTAILQAYALSFS